MKKYVLTSFALSAIIAMGSASAFAAAAEEYTLSVNDESIDADICLNGEKIMIPLRIVAEKLGFEVTWYGESREIELDNGEVKTEIRIGTDSYYMASSQAIGMSAPKALGAAPELKGDVTYVPADMFNILLLNDNAVTVSGTAVTITSEASESVRIPNPIVTYTSLDEAKSAVSFEVKTPQRLSSGFETAEILTIDNSLVEIVFKNGENNIYYRTAKGSGDISGDYNIYTETKTVKVGAIDVTLKTSSDRTAAIWTSGDYTFSLVSDKALSDAEITEIVESVL